jgi:hypothetical protein
MAKGYRPVVRDQGFLLPPDMREWLPGDHLVGSPNRADSCCQTAMQLRACPDTQVGCSWCDWLYRARRRLMMMIIDQ